MIIAVNYRGSVVAVNTTDGVVMWRADLKSAGVKGVAASPAVGRDGSLYFPDYGAGGLLRTSTRPLNHQNTETEPFARARVTAQVIRWPSHHISSPRVCMSIHPEGNSCRHLRSVRGLAPIGSRACCQ